jgi:hypothetical protein
MDNQLTPTTVTSGMIFSTSCDRLTVLQTGGAPSYAGQRPASQAAFYGYTLCNYLSRRSNLSYPYLDNLAGNGRPLQTAIIVYMRISTGL